MPEHRAEYSHTVSGASARPRQIDDQGPIRNTNDAAAQYRCWHTMISAVSRDRRCQLRNFMIQHGTRLLRGVISGTQSRTPCSDHYGVAGRYRISQRRTYRISVGHDHWT